jgi:hypothetical protein
MSTGEQVQSPLSRIFWVVVLSIVAFLLVYAIYMPNFVKSGPGYTNRIINNLRQLDGAKQQWALDHNRTGAVVVTKADIAPYLRRDFWVTPVAGESYTIGTLEQSPEAHLTRQVDNHAKGTVIRFAGDTIEFISSTNGLSR